MPRRRTAFAVSWLIALASAMAQNPQGALSGREIVISAGHGFYWHPTLGWTTQRPVIDELVEDRHTHEIIHDHVMPWLEGTGASVVLCRAPSRTTEEHLLQNDAGAPIYTESGPWFTSASSGFGGTSYRFANSDPQGAALASFRTTITATGVYPVYVAWRAGTNRLAAVQIRVHHAGGIALRTVDQRISDRRFVYIGSFPFRAFDVAEVSLSSQGPTGAVVIADAVRIGDGMGSVARGGTVSGQPKWLEASRYHAELMGAPASVYDSSTDIDNVDDVTCRPRFGEWFTEGRGDLYFSLHTNAGGGTGTDTFIYNGGATAGSQTWQQILHTTVIQALRARWDPAWVDRGQKTANFGELRLLSTMPGCLMELAFHDDLGGDLEALHHPDFRAIAGRAIADSMLAFLAPGAPRLLDPPFAVQARNDGPGRITARWRPVVGANGYRLQRSSDGFGWDEGQVITAASETTSGFGPGETVWFRVAAINASGRGAWSEPFGARAAPFGTAPILVVNGFDRRDRRHKESANPRDGLLDTGMLFAALADADAPFDTASNEAVADAFADLSTYEVLVWNLGAESTVDETFSALEQARVGAFLAQGKRLFVSGAELGWDLSARGSSADQAFFAQTLGLAYIADDALTYATQATLQGPLAPLPALTFANGSNGRYDVAFPDVLGPSPSGGGQVVLRYATGTGAGVLSRQGQVLAMGFPLETIVPRGAATQLLERALATMQALPLTATPPSALGGALRLDLRFAAAPGAAYVVASAFSETPSLPLQGGGAIPLAVDALFVASLDPQLSAIFQGFQGTLDASGRAAAQVLTPADPALSGLRVSFAAALWDPQAGVVIAISPAARATLP